MSAMAAGALARAATDANLLEVARRRKGPQFCIVDRGLHALYTRYADGDGNAVVDIPPSAAATVKDVIASLDAHADSAVALLAADIVVRVVRLAGDAGEHFAVFFERYEARNHVADATARFALTPREVDVLELLIRGASFCAIARQLYIAETTVQAHTKSIAHKMSCSSRAEIVATALGTR